MFTDREPTVLIFENGIAVIGLGYIGLPTCAAIAAHGIHVKGVDTNASTVSGINEGRVPMVEPDLHSAVAGAVARGYLSASTEVPEADAFLIAVPTPFKAKYQPDLSYVKAATLSIAPRLRGGEVVILESTSPPGTTLQISKWLAELRPDLAFPHESDDPDVHVAHCPERVLPGRIMIEIVTNDRVIGGLTPACSEKAAQIYRIFCEGEILFSDAASAEIAKLTENSYRDVNIAFANELASVCDELSLDVWEVIRLANRHPRVDILNPGPGVGGHCIAVDPWFIVSAAPKQARLIRTAREVNDARPGAVIDSIVNAVGTIVDPVIACLGLAFKANVDDVRESPAVTITKRLAERLPGASIVAVEPNIVHLPDSLARIANLTLIDASEALPKADVVVLLVDHSQFRGISASQLAGKQVIDTRGLWRDSSGAGLIPA